MTMLDSFVASLRNLQRGGVEHVEIGSLIDDLSRIAESLPTLPTLADVRQRSDDEISRASDELSAHHEAWASGNYTHEGEDDES